MTFDRIHRREFLQRLGLGTASAFALAGGVLGGCGRDRDPLRNALASFFDDPERAGAVGAAYRRATPTESTIDALLARVLDAGVAEARALAATDPGALYERLRAQHESDFAFDRVANVGGWMLSLTEARVCAVVSIAEG
jgi:hypothetical protein